MSTKQLMFCTEYLKDGNGTQAAIRAGYAENSAKEQASRLLTKDNVRNYIDTFKQQLPVTAVVTRERVLAEYAKIAFFDVRKFYDDQGNLKAVVDLDDETAAGIAGLEIEQTATFEDDPEDPYNLVEAPRLIRQVTATKKIKFTDKKSALDSICRMEGYNLPEAAIVHGKIETVVTYKRG